MKRGFSAMKRLLPWAIPLGILAFFVFVVINSQQTKVKKEAETAAAAEIRASPEFLAGLHARIKAETHRKIVAAGPLIRVGPDVIGSVYYGALSSLRLECGTIGHSVRVGFSDETSVDIYSFLTRHTDPSPPYPLQSAATNEMYETACDAARQALEEILTHRTAFDPSTARPCHK